VLETLNVEEAEEDLNREITRLKLANESLVSQRTMMNKPVLPDIEDVEKFHTQDLRMSDRNAEDREDGIDQTSLHPKEMNTMNDISQRKIVPTYGDTSVNGGKDIHISMGQSTMVMTSSPSRNVINKVLMKNNSTKEKFAEQNHSVPSGNQFTLNENNSSIVRGEMRDKPMKVSKMLYEEYKHPNTIEEEKKENPMVQERNSSHLPFYKSDSDNSEEEKVQEVALRNNVFMKQNEDESQGDGNIQIENLKKVVIKPHLNSSNVNSRKMSEESSHNRSSAKVSNNWVSRANSSSLNPPNSRNLHSSDRKREELLKESEEMLQEL